MTISLKCLPQLTGMIALFLVPSAFGQQAAGALSLTEAPASWSIFTASSPVRAIKALDGRGIAFQYMAVHDLSKAPLGAPGDHDWFGRYSLDLSVIIDGQKSMEWKGGTIVLHVKRHASETGYAYDGVSQGYSNIDGDPQTSLYEAWIRQVFFAGRLSVKAGRIDANTDFDAVPTAADFLNSSMGYSPTILQFPSYPHPQFGVDVAGFMGRSLRVSAGQFQTPDGSIILAEAARTWSLGEDQNAGRGVFGTWHFRGPMRNFVGKSQGGTGGVYSVLEQAVWKRPGATIAEDRQALRAFFQFGTGDGQANPFRCHLGGGMVFSAPWQRRPADAVGAAMTWVHFAGTVESNIDGRKEWVSETYYKLTLRRPVALITDIQYLRHPDGMRSHTDSLIVTPRLVVTF